MGYVDICIDELVQNLVPERPPLSDVLRGLFTLRSLFTSWRQDNTSIVAVV